MNIYDAITGVLQQSLSAPEIVTKIQASPDGSTLFFAHSLFVTMWDVQTGGLIHTFTTPSKINDIALSTTGDHIACGLSDGFVEFWNIHTKRKGRIFKNGQPVITIHWQSPMELVVAAQSSVYIHEIASGATSNTVSIPGHVWGLVHLCNDEFLVGTLMSGKGTNQEQCSLKVVSCRHQSVVHGRQPPMRLGQLVLQERQSPVHYGQLTHPMIVGDKIACITPPSGVQLFSTKSYDWTKTPPLLATAMSMSISLNRNLAVQTKDSIQIFTIGVLTSHEDRNIRTSGVYPLGENHILCFQSTGHITLLESETMRGLSPDDDILLFRPLAKDKAQSIPISYFSKPNNRARASLFNPPVASQAMMAWRSGEPFPRREFFYGDLPLIGLSPERTAIIYIFKWGLIVEDLKYGILLASLSVEWIGKVYDLAFDSETRFYIKIDGPEGHVQTPYDIITSSSRPPYTIVKGEPVPLSEPRARPPYTLDENCEWVLDARSRKICWISPSNLRRGEGGHFWVGSTLVMVRDDGVVNVTFKEPDC